MLQEWSRYWEFKYLQTHTPSPHHFFVEIENLDTFYLRFLLNPKETTII